MTLFEILQKNQKQLVHSDSDRRAIYLWDRKGTIQCFVQMRLGTDDWMETNAFETGTMVSFLEAQKRAMQWAKEL